MPTPFVTFLNEKLKMKSTNFPIWQRILERIFSKMAAMENEYVSYFARFPMGKMKLLKRTNIIGSCQNIYAAFPVLTWGHLKKVNHQTENNTTKQRRFFVDFPIE